MFSKKVEILCTNSSQRYYECIDILHKEGIRHTTKIVNQKSSSCLEFGKAHESIIGINKSAEYMFYIYVKKEDASYAKRIIGGV